MDQFCTSTTNFMISTLCGPILHIHYKFYNSHIIWTNSAHPLQILWYPQFVRTKILVHLKIHLCFIYACLIQDSLRLNWDQSMFNVNWLYVNVHILTPVHLLVLSIILFNKALILRLYTQVHCNLCGRYKSETCHRMWRTQKSKTSLKMHHTFLSIMSFQYQIHWVFILPDSCWLPIGQFISLH